MLIRGDTFGSPRCLMLYDKALGLLRPIILARHLRDSILDHLELGIILAQVLSDFLWLLLCSILFKVDSKFACELVESLFHALLTLE